MMATLPRRLGLSNEVVTDHWNLQYFSMTKILMCQQAQWSKYLSRFNLIIHFHPRKLGTKPDALTRQWDVYLKEGNSNYASVNLQNYHPVFTSENWHHPSQLSLSTPVLHGSLIMDAERLHSDLQSHFQEHPISAEHLDNQSDPQWTLNPAGLLCHLRCIYVPNSSNLQLCVLQYLHDHPL